MGHQWTRQEAQVANAKRMETGAGKERAVPIHPRKGSAGAVYTASRKNRLTGRYEYLVGQIWMTRQAVFYRRQRQRREPQH